MNSDHYCLIWPLGAPSVVVPSFQGLGGVRPDSLFTQGLIFFLSVSSVPNSESPMPAVLLS